MPWERLVLIFPASSSLFVTTMPPSPVVIFLLEKKLKQPTSLRVPTRTGALGRVVRRARGVGAILDNGQPPAPGQGGNGIHVNGVAPVMDHHNCLGARRYFGGGISGDKFRSWDPVTSRGTGFGPGIENRIGTGDEGQGRAEHLVSRARSNYSQARCKATVPS